MPSAWPRGAKYVLAPRGELGLRETYAYAAGEFGANMTWNMYSGFILFYYTNTVLLPVAAVGTLLLMTRVLDAIADPLIGVLVDRTHSRFGQARPWLAAVAIPFVIITVMTFSVPHWSVLARLTYAYATFTVAGLMFSAIYIPYSSMLPLMTRNPRTKLHIGCLRAVAASAGSIVIYAAMMPLVAALGRGDRQMGFSAAAGLMSVGTMACMLLVFFTCRERAEPQAGRAGENLLAGLAGMFRNPVWLIVTGFALAMFMRLGALVSTTAYFATDVLHAPWAIGALLSSLSVSLLLGGLLARPYLARFGKRRGNLFALAASIAATIAMLAGQYNVWAFGLLYFLGNITLGVQSATVFIMIADAVEAQQRMFGARNAGLLTSSASFATKVGMAVGSALVAYGLALVQYDPVLVTDAARDRISLLYFLGPAFFAVLQMAIIALYNDSRHNQAMPAGDFQEIVL